MMVDMKGRKQFQCQESSHYEVNQINENKIILFFSENVAYTHCVLHP